MQPNKMFCFELKMEILLLGAFFTSYEVISVDMLPKQHQLSWWLRP